MESNPVLREKALGAKLLCRKNLVNLERLSLHLIPAITYQYRLFHDIPTGLISNILCFVFFIIHVHKSWSVCFKVLGSPSALVFSLHLTLLQCSYCSISWHVYIIVTNVECTIRKTHIYKRWPALTKHVELSWSHANKSSLYIQIYITFYALYDRVNIYISVLSHVQQQKKHLQKVLLIK